MALPIRSTPALKGADSERFMKIIASSKDIIIPKETIDRIKSLTEDILNKYKQKKQYETQHHPHSSSKRR